VRMVAQRGPWWTVNGCFKRLDGTVGGRGCAPCSFERAARRALEPLFFGFCHMRASLLALTHSRSAFSFRRADIQDGEDIPPDLRESAFPTGAPRVAVKRICVEEATPALAERVARW